MLFYYTRWKRCFNITAADLNADFPFVITFYWFGWFNSSLNWVFNPGINYWQHRKNKSSHVSKCAERPVNWGPSEGARMAPVSCVALIAMPFAARCINPPARLPPTRQRPGNGPGVGYSWGTNQSAHPSLGREALTGSTCAPFAELRSPHSQNELSKFFLKKDQLYLWCNCKVVYGFEYYNYFRYYDSNHKRERCTR